MISIGWTGKPVRYQRHRCKCHGGHGRAYSPPAYENAKKTAIKRIDPAVFPSEPIKGQLVCVMHFVVPTKDPKKWGKPHSVMPDLDNFMKAALDILVSCGVLEDDRYVFGVSAVAMYGQNGMTTVTIDEGQL